MDPAAVVQALLQWSNLGGLVISAGVGLFDQIDGLIKAHGHEADTAKFRELIVENERLRAVVEREKLLIAQEKAAEAEAKG